MKEWVKGVYIEILARENKYPNELRIYMTCESVDKNGQVHNLRWEIARDNWIRNGQTLREWLDERMGKRHIYRNYWQGFGSR